MRNVSTGNRRGGFVLAIVVVGAAALSACGNATETGLEKVIEQQGGGNVDIDTDDGGISIQTEDGSMTIDEDGNFVVTDENGETITGSADADGESFNVESEDGSFSAGATTELPEEWPGEIPQPSGLAITSATVIGSDGETAITVSGTVAGDGFVESYAGALESAGFDEESTFTSDGMINNVYANDMWRVGVVYFGDESENQVTVSVYSSN